MRKNFRKLLKRFDNYRDLSDWLGCSYDNLKMMASRGYLSKKYAKVVEAKTNGEIRALSLIKQVKI